MRIKKKHIGAAIGLSTLVLNLFSASTVFGQAPTGLDINITRTSYLSFINIPASFSFPSIPVPLVDTQLFSDANGYLNPISRALEIQDTRDSGGITVQAQATNLVSTTNPADVIPATKLRIVSTSSLGTMNSSIVNNVHYMAGFLGTPNAPTVETILAPINAATTNFADVATFTAVGATLDTPVNILSGCLPAAQGRNGVFGVGLSYNLTVPGYTVPATYTATVTYTVTDNTQITCP